MHVRSAEQPVNLDDGDQYDFPWLYAVQVGEWGLTDQQAKEMREYLLRGGFFMADDFHGALEWEMFEKRIKKVFPDRPIVDIQDDDPIFHTVYDLDDRYQVPGAAHRADGLQAPDYAQGAGDGHGRTGAESTTITAGSWWRSRITRISAMRGNGRTSRRIRRNFRTWRFGSE